MIEHKLLCKAKNNNDKWVYGFFIKVKEYTQSPCDNKPAPYKCFIVKERDIDWNMPTELQFIPVKEETLYKYIGKDKNGNLMWEKVD